MSKQKLTLVFEVRNPKYLKMLGGGVSCTVVEHPTDQDKVVKIYNTSQEAMFAYVRQRIFARKNFAPQVFERVEATFDCGVFYGFVSEKVKLIEQDYDVRHHPDYSNHIMRYNLYQMGDWGYANIGIKNDKLVPIDFGLDSEFQTWKKYKERLLKLT